MKSVLSNLVEPGAAVVVTLVALFTCCLLVRRSGPEPEPARYATIDGLRGYLALFVFVHHACVWYFYLRTGNWDRPPSQLFMHLGRSSVALFFMITGFLFFDKLISARSGELDWFRLFVSRLTRLVPLYLFAVLLLLLIVGTMSNWSVAEPLPLLLKNIAHWLSFTILDQPDVNGVKSTLVIVAGVTWSLPYEICFYMLLPLLGLGIGIVPPRPYIALGAVALVALIVLQPMVFHLYPFLGGIGAALLARSALCREVSSTWAASLIPLGCIALTVTLFPSPYELMPMFLLSIAFIFIACGNNLFGLLSWRASRTLGDMSYSIYMLHGILLFCTLNFVVGAPTARLLSPEAHWLLMIALTPLLVTVCFLTFRYIEMPAMQRTGAVTAWLRARHRPRPGSIHAGGSESTSSFQGSNSR